MWPLTADLPGLKPSSTYLHTLSTAQLVVTHPFCITELNSLAQHDYHTAITKLQGFGSFTRRYIASDEEGGSADAGDGLPVRQSQGADLQQLLAESEQFYGQAHFRYRSFIEAVDVEPPLVDVAAFEEVRTALAAVARNATPRVLASLAVST